jgi:hypothetical protein
MKQSTLRACAGCFSALLGLTLVTASCYHMYAEEVRYVGQQLRARELLDYAEEAPCTPDETHVGKLIYLHNCDFKSMRPLAELEYGSLKSSEAMASVGDSKAQAWYTFCPEHNHGRGVKVHIPDPAPKGEHLLAEKIGELPPACKPENAGKWDITAAAARSEASPDFERVSVIAVQAAGGVLVRVEMEAFGEVAGGVWVVESGDHSKDGLVDDLHVPRMAPQWVVIFLVFAGVCAINVGVAEIPGYKIPGPCRVPQFQTCSLSLIATIAVMVTLILCGALFGFAWAKYHVLLSVPLFVASLTSMCLLIFVRFRCSYDGYDDDEDEQKSLLDAQSSQYTVEQS